MDPKEQQIAILAVEAVRDHGVSHSSILSAIRTALREASAQLPNKRVLVNRCHGGYGLSNAFRAWDAVEWDDEDRPRLAGRMEAFGAHVASAYPSIGAIVSVVSSPAGKALDAALRVAASSRDARETLADIDDNLRAIDAMLADKFSSWGSRTGMTRWVLTANRKDLLRNYHLSKFTRESAQSFRDTFDVAALRREYQAKAEVSLDLPEEIVAAIEAYRKPDPPYDDMHGFMDVFVAGAGDGVRAWFFCQRSVSTSAAAFLAGFWASPESAVHRHFFGAGTTVPMETIGLLAASGPYACLAIDEVPALAGWTVHEYDGLESAIVV